MKKFATQQWIIRTAGRAWWLVALLCLLQGAMAANGVVFALCMRNTVDAAVAGEQQAFLLALGAFAAVMVLQVALRTVNRYATERASASVENRLRGWAFQSILSQPFKPSEERLHSGELMTRMTSDAHVVSAGITTFMPTVVSMGVRVVGVFGAMFVLVPHLALLFLGVGLALALASLAFRGVMKRLHKRVQEAEGGMRSFLQECLESLLVIRAFGVEHKMQDANFANMQTHKQARLRRSNVSNAANTGLSLAIQGGYVLGFAWCGFGILEGTVTYGTLMAVIQLIGQIQSPFASMGGVFSRYSAMLASAERLMELDEGPRPNTVCPQTPAQVYANMDALCFSGVSFGYGDDAVLSDFTCEIPRGSFVAVAGSSGIGKSTLMKLLLGAFRPKQGEVFLRAQDGQQLSIKDAPVGVFAYVPQGNHLMSGSVRDVIALAEGASVADEARMLQACEIACAADFISQLPNGLDTQLGEHGAGLSEGQMQRLAVARAVYSQAPILLLDEATSALDAQTERAMLTNLKALKDRMVIVVTHRPEALGMADMVVRLGRPQINAKEAAPAHAS